MTEKESLDLFLNIIICKSAAIFELLPCEDQALLIGWDAFLVLDLRLDVVDGIVGLNLRKLKPLDALSMVFMKGAQTG